MVVSMLDIQANHLLSNSIIIMIYAAYAFTHNYMYQMASYNYAITNKQLNCCNNHMHMKVQLYTMV